MLPLLLLPRVLLRPRGRLLRQPPGYHHHRHQHRQDHHPHLLLIMIMTTPTLSCTPGQNTSTLPWPTWTVWYRPRKTRFYSCWCWGLRRSLVPFQLWISIQPTHVDIKTLTSSRNWTKRRASPQEQLNINLRPTMVDHWCVQKPLSGTLLLWYEWAILGGRKNGRLDALNLASGSDPSCESMRGVWHFSVALES